MQTGLIRFHNLFMNKIARFLKQSDDLHKVVKCLLKKRKHVTFEDVVRTLETRRYPYNPVPLADFLKKNYGIHSTPKFWQNKDILTTPVGEDLSV